MGMGLTVRLSVRSSRCCVISEKHHVQSRSFFTKCQLTLVFYDVIRYYRNLKDIFPVKQFSTDNHFLHSRKSYFVVVVAVDRRQMHTARQWCSLWGGGEGVTGWVIKLSWVGQITDLTRNPNFQRIGLYLEWLQHFIRCSSSRSDSNNSSHCALAPLSKYVFNDCQNLLYDKSASFRCDGRLFHRPGPAAAKHSNGK